MAKIKALVTRRGGSPSVESLTSEAATVLNAGVNVEQQTPGSLLVSGNDAELEALERQGYRVKVLPNTDQLRIGDHTIHTEAGPPDLPRTYRLTKAQANDWTHHLVQLVAPPTDEWTKAIEAQGVDVVEPVSAYGLFVVGSAERVTALRSLPFVAWTGPFEPAYRVSPELREKRGRIEDLHVLVYPAEATESVRRLAEAEGGTVVDEWDAKPTQGGVYHVLALRIDSRAVPVLARHPDVRWLEFVDPQSVPDDERSAQIVAENLNGAAAPNTAPVPGYQAELTTLGLSGAGVVVGICDTGVDTHNDATLHPDLAGRLAFFVDATGGATPQDGWAQPSGSNGCGHGTHVAGIAVGNGASGDTNPQGFLLGQGMAPAARLGSINAIAQGASMNVGERIRRMAENGAHVMNNSWRAPGGSGYSATAVEVDQLVRDPNPATPGLDKMHVVFSAGNSGPGAGTITHPKEAKNVIVVGNSLNNRPGEGGGDIRGLASSSSRGPAADGRILPNVVAPGSNIVSARSRPAAALPDLLTAVPGNQTFGLYTDSGGTAHTDYLPMSGTSMAAPHVAGLSALLVEWWRQRTGQDPSPALVKALLINGAIDLAGGTNGNGGTLANIPNNDQGWGRVSLENVVTQAPASDRGPKLFSDQRHAFTADGQEFTIRVAAVDATRPLRVTLVWTDAPGAAGGGQALVNDLDLEVRNAAGDLFKGNVFANGFSTTGGAADPLNNIECVYLQTPGAGIHEITVVASNLRGNARPPFDTTPWQDFALVVDNAEFAVADPVSVVPVIDRSGSMAFYGYTDYTQSSSRQFVDLLSPGDGLAVVSFGTTATTNFSNGGTLATVAGTAEKDAAKTAIDGLAFTGMTFMGGGLQTASSLLAPVTGERAIVLLSDGYDNRGGVPGNPSALSVLAGMPGDLPVYTCAMGPASDQTLLQQIATTTDGRYFYMPTIDDLHEIYNYIRGQVTGTSIIVNEAAMASSSRVGGFVDRFATKATFSVVWMNEKLKFTLGDARKSNEISIRLRDPKGRLLPAHCSYLRRTVGQGYVIFQLEEPLPGQWFVEVTTGGDSHTRYVVGGFVQSPLRLAVALRKRELLAGAPLDLAVQVLDDKRVVRGLQARASVLAPVMGLPTLHDKFKDKLANVRPGRGLLDDGVPRPQAQLMTLHDRLVKEGKPGLFESRVLAPSPFRRTELPAGVGFQAGAGLATRFAATQESGSYNVVVQVGGISEHSNTRFVRKQLVSVVVK